MKAKIGLRVSPWGGAAHKDIEAASFEYMVFTKDGNPVNLFAPSGPDPPFLILHDQSPPMPALPGKIGISSPKESA